MSLAVSETYPREMQASLAAYGNSIARVARWSRETLGGGGTMTREERGRREVSRLAMSTTMAARCPDPNATGPKGALAGLTLSHQPEPTQWIPTTGK
jgi:hypothetical protein